LANKESLKTERAVRSHLAAYQARQDSFERLRSRRKRDNRIWAIVGAVVILAAIGSQVGFSLSNSTTQPSASASGKPAGVPSKDLAQGKTWSGVLGIDNVALSLTLDGAKAPQAVSSTLQLSQSGFYKNLKCHRLTTSGIFVLQCGDPQGDGTGGPGYSYGPIENAPAGDLYPAGTIAMARQGNNASSQGSQFFIVYKDSVIPSDSVGGYTVIGHINAGLPQLLKNVISSGTVDGSTDGAPKQTVLINYFNIFAQ
jgi:peptidyl-prolyl cis-trans isomerase B (cyclophilin B)